METLLVQGLEAAVGIHPSSGWPALQPRDGAPGSQGEGLAEAGGSRGGLGAEPPGEESEGPGRGFRALSPGNET